MFKRISAIAVCGIILFVSSAVAQEQRYSSGYPQWGLGVASATSFTNTAAALSGWYALNGDSAIQSYFVLPGTSPFIFSIGAAYKKTTSGNNSAGFHIGGGVGLGNQAATANDTVFFININGLLGGHFFIPSIRNLIINFDAGPSLAIVDGDASFSIDSVSALLGLSIHYIF